MSASQRESLGYPNGFDAGDFYLGPPCFSMGEAAARRPGPSARRQIGCASDRPTVAQPGNDILPPRSAAILARASRSRPQHSRYVICRYGNAFGMSSPSGSNKHCGATSRSKSGFSGYRYSRRSDTRSEASWPGTRRSDPTEIGRQR